MLTTEHVRTLQEKLKKTEEELRAGIKDLEVVPEFGSDIDHFEEETNEAEEFSKNLGETKVFRERLRNVEHALHKMEAGAYGACEICGKEIGLDLLMVDPESRLCKECKQQIQR